MKTSQKFGTVIASLSILAATGCGVHSTSGSANSTNSGASSGSKSTSTGALSSTQFPTRTITIVVPDKPGGSMDTSARILAEYLPQYLLNHPSVIVKNMPGGNDAIGISSVYSAKPDGYTLGNFPMPGVIVGPFIGEGTYDMTKFQWLGELFNQGYVMVVSKKSGINSFSDLLKKHELTITETGPTTSPGIAAIETTKSLHIKLNFVPSGGSSQCLLAVSQGSVDATIFPYAAEKQEIQSGMVKPLFAYSSKRLPELPNTPTISELGHPELTNVLSTRADIAAPPGTPQDITNILRQALQEASNDSNYRQKMSSANLDPAFMDGASLQTQVQKDKQSLQAAIPDIKEFMKK
ncbi:tripartite tricarboxylate transporter substrate binding protein [Alicyclobacillus dauci]|uniref:Tripartite tricarboxylate transporter substrate binding protein n=1 Tax=Alicyclobacillus dauci TaxID=1475485 RepID=A0ABY6Z6T1_9BACL|nr:tripartite tricarboxylate transporter substrate binding protein [Alicyclobacillus dauci]WAH37986.1 tripartite tricarboxylate transporter substrate binding protein [Alicyclobacillus dauci]